MVAAERVRTLVCSLVQLVGESFPLYRNGNDWTNHNEEGSLDKEKRQRLELCRNVVAYPETPINLLLPFKGSEVDVVLENGLPFL